MDVAISLDNCLAKYQLLQYQFIILYHILYLECPCNIPGIYINLGSILIVCSILYKQQKKEVCVSQFSFRTVLLGNKSHTTVKPVYFPLNGGTHL